MSTTNAVTDNEPKPQPIEDLVGDPSPENPAEQGGDTSSADDNIIAPEPGEATPAVETPPVDAASGGTAVEPAPEPVEEEVKLETLEDGKGFKLGKYQAETVEQLLVEVEKGRRNAEKLIGKKAEPAADTNPFLNPEDEEFEDFGDEVFDEAELGSAFGAGIAQALVQQGIVPQQGGQQADPQVAVVQAMSYAQQVIDSPNASDQDFQAVLQALVLNAPGDEQARNTVLAEWASRGPAQQVAASQEAANIQFAFNQFAAQQEQAQHQAAWEQQQQQQVAAQEGERAVAQAYIDASSAFTERNPDWANHNTSMHAWMERNRPLMEAAKGNPAAIFSVFDSALQYAKAVDASAPIAGIGAGVSEQSTNMGSVSDTGASDVAAANREAIAESRGLAGLETGAAIDNVTVQITNPNPPGLAETPLEDVIGMPMVKQ